MKFLMEKQITNFWIAGFFVVPAINATIVFPRIVSAETILFWKLDCDHYSREEIIQGRKLFFYFTFCIQFYFPSLNNGRKYYYKVHIFCGLFRIYEL